MHLTKEMNIISLHNALGYDFVPVDKFGKISIKYLITSVADFPFTVNSSIFIPKEKQVIQSYSQQKLTPITIFELARLCSTYPDIEFILDTKYTNYNLYMKQFQVIREVFDYFELNLHKLTPQFYNVQMADNILREFSFINNIYTLYMQPFNQEAILKQIQKSDNINGVTISKTRLLKDLKFIKRIHELGKQCNVHTITNEQEIDEFSKSNVDGIYTFVKNTILI